MREVRFGPSLVVGSSEPVSFTASGYYAPFARRSSSSAQLLEGTSRWARVASPRELSTCAMILTLAIASGVAPSVACSPFGTDTGPKPSGGAPSRALDDAAAAAPPDAHAPASPLAIVASAEEYQVTQGQSLVVPVKLVRGEGLHGSVHVSVVGLREGLAAVEVVSSSDEAVLEVHASAAAAQGSLDARVEATCAGERASAPLALYVRGAPGALDTTFGTRGNYTEPIHGATAGAIDVGANDALVVAYRCTRGLCVHRLGRDGALDTAYGGDGALSTGLEFPVVRNVFAKLAPSGALVVGSEGADAAGSGLAMLQANGLHEPTFGDGTFGVGTMTTPFSAGLSGIATTDDGDFVVAGLDSDLHGVSFALRRFGPTGLAREAFGVHGRAAVELRASAQSGGAGLGFVPWGLGTRPEGDVFVVGHGRQGELASYGICELKGATGAYDPAFATGGRQAVPFTLEGTLRRATDDGVAVGPDGGVVAAFGTDARDAYWLTAFDRDGFPNSAFGKDGLAGPFPVASHGWPAAVRVDMEGRILVLTLPPSPQSPSRLVRFTSAGNVDVTFGVGGIVTSDAAVSGRHAGLVLQHDGRIVILVSKGTGRDDEQMTVTRYWN